MSCFCFDAVGGQLLFAVSFAGVRPPNRDTGADSHSTLASI